MTSIPTPQDTPESYTDTLVATAHLMACERMSKGFRSEITKEKPSTTSLRKS